MVYSRFAGEVRPMISSGSLSCLAAKAAAREVREEAEVMIRAVGPPSWVAATCAMPQPVPKSTPVAIS